MTLTPEQFSRIALKEDLKDFEKRLEEKLDKKLDKILNSVDGLATSVKNFNVEMAANQGAHDRMTEDIKNHEVRIKKLELLE